AVRGKVRVVAEQREQDLVAAEAIEVATIHGTVATEALYLARAAAGYVVYALGKSGEPRAQRPVSVVIVHRWSRIELTCELATDAHGRIELGELPGIQRITATLGATTQTWIPDDPECACPPIVAEVGAPVIVPVPASRTSAELVRGLSLVEIRGGAPQRHVSEAKITQLASGIRIDG